MFNSIEKRIILDFLESFENLIESRNRKTSPSNMALQLSA